MVPERIRRVVGRASGYTLAELIVVIAVIGVTIAVAIPSLWTYYRASALRAASEQTVVMLNTARQLAIRLNTTMCVTIDSTGMQYHKDTCSAAAYVMAGTDASGYLQLPSGLTLSGTSNICFGYLGGPPPPPVPVGCNMSGTITVTRASGGSMNIVIASPGRVRLQ